MSKQETKFYYFDGPDDGAEQLQNLIDANFKIVCFQIVYCPGKSWTFYMTVVIEKELNNV